MNKIYIALIFFLMMGISVVVTASSSIIGIGDAVRISVYEHPDLLTVTRVSDNGKISFPLIGQTKLSGLSERDAEIRIASLLSQGSFVRSPQVSVIVETFNSQKTSVMGFVNKPGNYPIQRGNYLVDILSQAGGLSSEAGNKVVILKKNNKQRIVVDAIEIFLGDGKQTNIIVEDGDMIYVPKMDIFYIYGQVQKPGSYRLERNMNVMQAISVGGSITAKGTERGMKIKRQESNGTVKEIPAKPTDALLPNDIIYVKESLF